MQDIQTSSLLRRLFNTCNTGGGLSQRALIEEFSIYLMVKASGRSIEYDEFSLQLQAAKEIKTGNSNKSIAIKKILSMVFFLRTKKIVVVG